MSVRVFAAAGLAIALLAGGAGFKLGNDLCEGRHARAAVKQVKKDARQAGAVRQLGADHAARETVRESTFREIIREVPNVVTRPVYRSQCLDADGVRLLDAAVDVANAGDQPAAARAGAALPEGAAPGGQD